MSDYFKKACARDRIIAAVIDLFLLCALDAVIILPLRFFLNAPLALCPCIIPVCHIVYCTLFCVSDMCATPGMFIRNLRIAGRDAEATGFLKVLFRSVCSFFSCIPLGIGLLSCLWDPEHCTFYDYASNTFVFAMFEESGGEEKEAYIVVHDGHGNPKKYLVTSGGITIGRDPDVCQVLFPPDELNISRQHCVVKINRQTGVFLLKDCDSKCGTFLENGANVPSDKYATLQPGDSFFVGRKDVSVTVMFGNR
ncbi:MAG: FHA domain-containing protein [Clostridiales bacterium]|nr:FHA domain-containing protein [Clostridiales bacterium]